MIKLGLCIINEYGVSACVGDRIMLNAPVSGWVVSGQVYTITNLGLDGVVTLDDALKVPIMSIIDFKKV